MANFLFVWYFYICIQTPRYIFNKYVQIVKFYVFNVNLFTWELPAFKTFVCLDYVKSNFKTLKDQILEVTAGTLLF